MPANVSRRASAKDVARLAGVSTATVTRVLNSPERVHAETERVLREAVASGETELDSAGWAPVRSYLSDLSRRRAAQGFTPSETAVFVFSIRPPLFARVDDFGVPLRGLVNNAGISTPPSTVADMSGERINHTMLVNSVSPMIVARHAVHRMAVSRGGSGGAIVNVSSRLSELGAAGRHVDYAASKAALDGFTRGLGREVVGDGIRVNAVRPGVIDTEIYASIGEPDRAQQMASMIPMGRPGRAEEVADAIVWLLSDESSYVSACLVEVSGGR